MDHVHEIHKSVRAIVFAQLWADVGVCFSFFNPDDAGPGQRGELFEQDDDFLMVEVDIDTVRRAGPGIHSPKRVFGGVNLTYYSKNRYDLVGLESRLEAAGDWFAQQTLDGVRYREYVPTGDGRNRGFQFHSATIPFEFEIH